MSKVRVIHIEDLDSEYNVKVDDIGEIVEDVDPILVRFDRGNEPLYHYLWLWQVEVEG